MPRLAIYAAGSNSHGQLGIGSRDDVHSFTLCPLSDGVQVSKDVEVKVLAGANHTLVLLKGLGKTRLLAAGASKQGQLGKQEDLLSFSFEPVLIQDLLSCLPPGKEREQVLAPGASWTPVDAAAGWETSLLLLNDARHEKSTVILALGSNDFGQLGKVPKGTTANLVASGSGKPFRSISSGPRHCVAMDTEGQAWGWGASRHGQLGALREASIPHELGAIALAHADRRPVVDVAVGQQHTALLLHQDVRNGGQEVHVLGNNRQGQLGNADLQARIHTIQTSTLDDEASHAAVYSTWNTTFIHSVKDRSSRLFSFGRSANGQLGRNGEILGSIGEVLLPRDRQILQISAGSEHVLALLETGQTREVWGWGWNEHGNLGVQNGKLEDVRLPIKLWAPVALGEVIRSVHAGNGTSWIVTLQGVVDD